MRACRACGELKEDSEFYTHHRRGPYAKCAACCREYERNQLRKPRPWAFSALARCQERAKARGTPCTITVEHIIELLPADGRCPVFRTPLQYGGGKRVSDSASVDEVRHGEGYVPGNIVVVSHRANIAKNDLSIDELCRLAEYYRSMS